MLASTAMACNIPVFRYALERWRPDECEVVVFSEGPLAKADLQQLELMGLAIEPVQGQPASKRKLKLVVSDTHSETDDKLRQQWERLKKSDMAELPYMLVRAPTRRGPVVVWSGALEQAGVKQMLDSPIRNELAKRLLGGHSVVWLLVQSKDEAKNHAARAVLEEQSKKLMSSVQLPEGIGLPGSELFSNVPLYVKFSVLEIQPDDPHEAFLVNLFSGLQREAFEAGQPLLVPVFGRGRALEVIPADSLDDALVSDLAQFLCAACSCQVKEQNPGFDLLLNVDWEQALFGSDGQRPPLAESQPSGLDAQPTPPQKPQLLTIPPGRKR